MNTFADLGLSKRALVSLNKVGFTEPTEIQSKAIPPMLEQLDVMASAQTGSGKTAAYVLPLVEHLERRNKVCRALVLVPTRELAIQVKEQVDRFTAHDQLKTILLYGGTGYEKQIRGLRAFPDVIVATPGRLIDFINRGMADLSMVELLILDEADRLLDFGFMPQIRKIIDQIPTQRQTALFSATIDEGVSKLAKEYMKHPVRLAVDAEKLDPSTIDQQFHKTSESEKEDLLYKIIEDAGKGSVLVFARTRRKAKTLAASLRKAAIQAHEIHGDLSQSKREQTLDMYRKGKFNVLVATDVAARGLDISAISHVVNYDLPQLPADYVHRIGRTGRAGRTGTSHTFVCDGDNSKLIEIEKVVGRTLMERPESELVHPKRPKRNRPKNRKHNIGRGLNLVFEKEKFEESIKQFHQGVTVEV